MTIRNAELLHKIADIIEREPARYDQGDWAHFTHNEQGKRVLEPCHTRCCVAGHSILESATREQFDKALQTVTELIAQHKARNGKARNGGEVRYFTRDQEQEFDRQFINCLAADGLGLSLDDRLIDTQSISTRAMQLLGLEKPEANVLFDERWKPYPGMTVPEALRALADGVGIDDVTSEDFDDDDDYPDEQTISTTMTMTMTDKNPFDLMADSATHHIPTKWGVFKATKAGDWYIVADPQGIAWGEGHTIEDATHDWELAAREILHLLMTKEIHPTLEVRRDTLNKWFP